MVKSLLSNIGNTLGDMSLPELFFYVLLAVCVVFQTWGYSFRDASYVGSVVLVGFLALAKILASRYTRRDLISRYTRRDLIICALLLGVGLFFVLKAHRYTVLLSVVLLIAAKGVPTRRLLTSFLGIKLFAIVSLFILAAIGVFDVEAVQHYRMTTGEIEMRMLINGAATNIVHLGFFTVAVLWLCLKYERIRVHHVVLLLVLDVAMYLSVTRSAAGVALSALAALLIFACSKSRVVESVFLRLAPLVPFGLMLVMVAFGYTYGSSGFMDFVNKLSTGRIAYDHYWLVTYGPTLFGADYAQLIDEGNFDDSFVYVIVVYGVVFGALLYGAVTKLLVEMRREGAASGALLVALFLVYSAAESMYPSAVVNPSLFLLTSVLFDGQPKAGGLDDGGEQGTGHRMGDSLYIDNRLHILRGHVQCGAAGAPRSAGLLVCVRHVGQTCERRRAAAFGFAPRRSEPCDWFGHTHWWERIGEYELSYPDSLRDMRRTLLLDCCRKAGQAYARRVQPMVLVARSLVRCHDRRGTQCLIASSACYAEKPHLLVHVLLRCKDVSGHEKETGLFLSTIRLALRRSCSSRFCRYGCSWQG